MAEQHPEVLVVDWTTLDRKANAGGSPRPRIKHQACLWANRLYLFGGEVPSPEEDALQLDCLDLAPHGRWERVQLQCGSNSLVSLSGCAGALLGSDWYLFGGVDRQLRSRNQLWKISLQTLDVSQVEGQGTTPSARQSAGLLPLEGRGLVLYGGLNTNAVQIYNDLHFFDAEQSCWTRAEGSYLAQVQPRYDCALALLGTHVYLFGGLYRNTSNEEVYLNDFYQFALPQTMQPNITVRRLQGSGPHPEPRAGHSLLPLPSDRLLLLPGDQQGPQPRDALRSEAVRLVQSLWLYSVRVREWSRVVLRQSHLFPFSVLYSATSNNSQILLFGGLRPPAQPHSALCQLSLPSTLEPARSQDSCAVCDLGEKELRLSLELAEDLAGQLQFAFAAVGLLVDGAVAHGASFATIRYLEGSPELPQPHLKLTDNARLPWTDAEFFASMASFSAQTWQPPAGCDKKTKMALLREQQRRDYGTHAKLAALRLGEGFLHLSQGQEGLRVCLLRKEGSPLVLRLRCYTHQQQPQSTLQREVEAEFGPLIRRCLSQTEVRNTMVVLRPKVQDLRGPETAELKASERHNDLLNCGLSDFGQLQEGGFNVTECVDVSLRAYLVSLYLKNESTQISLGVKGSEEVVVATQSYLERVDRLCRHRHAFEVNCALDFDFKIVELYFLYDLRKKVNFFSNGLLIYQRNRLLTRFKHPLGQLLPRKMHRAPGHHNFLRFFGFLELPDHLPANSLRTDVAYPLMLERLSARLQFLSRCFKLQFQRLALGPKRVGPVRGSEEEARQDLNDNPELLGGEGAGDPVLPESPPGA